MRRPAGRYALARRLLCSLVAALASVGAHPLLAADSNAQFIAALREQGWDDTAVDYIGWVEKSPLMTPAFAQELPFQRALSLASQAKQTKNRAERERLQAEAAAAFQQYAQIQPDSPQALDALREAANLYASQALSTLAAAQRLPSQAAAEKEKARGDARALFKRASEATERIIELCTVGLAALPKAAEAQADPQAKGRRDLLRDRQAEARFLHARVTFESAATFDGGAKERADALDAAAAQFGKLVEEYRQSIVGDTSRFYQGRCAQELGAYEKALGCYRDALGTATPGSASPSPDVLRLRARACRYTAECLVAIDKRDEAIEWCEAWLGGCKPAERGQPEWLEVAYTLATIYQHQAKGADAGGNDAKQLAAKARTLFRDASQRPNEFQQQARLALAALGQPARQGAESKTFADAYAAGKAALDVWSSSSQAVRLAKDNNPEAVAELEDQAAQQKAEALQAFERALELGDRQTPIDDLNQVRYLLTVLYWEEQRIYEAAVLGEFLATRYPDNENAVNAARVAMAAYEQAAIEALATPSGGDADTPQGSTVARQKLARLAELMAARWPETPEASSAVNVLIQTALRDDRLADAEALLERLPAESRRAAELSLGAGLWSRYLRATAGQAATPGVEVTAQRDKAGRLLASGFAGLRENGEPTAAAAAGALYYVQYLLATGDANGAATALEDENAGPLTLIAAQSPAAARPDFVLETYKAALRTYLSVQPPRPDKAEEMLAALEAFAAQQRRDGKKLTDIYLSLAVQLQRQLQELTAAGQQAQARAVAAAFGNVLARVAQRPEADSWPMRSWIAQTNLQIGKLLGGDDAKAYADRARDAYEGMLAAAARDKSYAPDATALLAVRMRLGECLAAEGEYEKAIDQYAEILREKPNTLDLQLAAATALQQWGVAQRDPAAIDRSIRGDKLQADGKNLIWGWLRLASMAQQARQQASRGTVDEASRQRSERFRDLFFEARYNIARSRFLAASIVDAGARQEQLQAAKTNIEQMQQLYPDLGGDKWRGAYEQLLDQVNKELGNK